MNYSMVLALFTISLFIPAISHHQKSMEEAQSKIEQQKQIMVRMQRDEALKTNEIGGGKVTKDKKDSRYIQYPLPRSVITSHFGYRNSPMGGGHGYARLHKGVDMIGPLNSEIKSVTNGKVVEHWPAPDYYYSGHPVFGGLVVIEHNERFYLYGHMKETFVDEGERVDRGDVIGIMGATGVATGPHLHFEVVTDPMQYIRYADRKGE
jgi:murein DD-endopeptidase MepM/ murein hydrolase activator NlpD